MNSGPKPDSGRSCHGPAAPKPLISRPVFAAVMLASVAAWVPGFFFPEMGRIESERARSIELAMEGRGWLIPMQDDGPDIQKPPLLFWLSAGVAAIVRGVGTFCIRAPAFLASLCTLGVLYWYVRRRFGPATARIAVTVLALTGDFAFYARTGSRGHDNLLCLAIASLVASADVYWHSRRPLHLIPVVLATAAGVLAKGFPILLVAGLFGVAMFALARSGRWGLDVAPLRGLGLAVLVAVILSGVWFGIAAAAVPGYAHFLRDVSRKVLVRESDLLVPLYFLYGLPWSLLVPWMVARFPRQRRSPTPEDSVILLGGWAAATLVVLGLVVRGGEHYLLSFYPLVAALIARDIETRNESEETFPRVMYVFGAVAAAWMFSALVPLLHDPADPEVARMFAARRSPVLVIPQALAGLSFLAWAIRWRRLPEPRKVFAFLCAAGMTLTALQIPEAVLPARRAGFGDFAARATAAMRKQPTVECVAATGFLPAPVRWLPECRKPAAGKDLRTVLSERRELFVVTYHGIKEEIPDERCRLLLASEQAYDYDDTLYLHFCPQPAPEGNPGR